MSRRKDSRVAEDTDQFGEYNKRIFIAVRVLHLIDLILGVLIVAYGITLDINGAQLTVGISFTVFGLALILSAFIGSMGFMLPMCGRFLMVLSALMGILIGITYIIVFIVALVNKDAIFDTLSEHNTDFDLTHDQVDSFEAFFIPWDILLLLLAAFQFFRAYAIWKLRNDLVSIENMVAVPNRGDPHAEPLLDDDAYDDTDTDSDFAPVDGQLYTDGNWWADKNQFQDIAKDDKTENEEVWASPSGTAEGDGIKVGDSVI